MNKQHYPSLELCKRLTEAGFPETFMVYAKGPSGEFIDIAREAEYEGYRCPSISELLDELPQTIVVDGEINYLKVDKTGVCYDGKKTGFCIAGTIPNALAEIWLWLKENNYI